MRRTIVLAGAPDTAKLDWDEKTLLSESAVQEVVSNPTPSLPSSNAFSAQWRQLPESLRMRPVLPKLDIEPHPKTDTDTSAAEFFTPFEFISPEASNDVSREETQELDGTDREVLEAPQQALSEFYGHSFAIHEAVPSSQLSALSELTPGTPTYDSNEEMFPETPKSTGSIIRSPSQRRLSQMPRPKHLTDLEDIPNANYLSSIEPQTMTVHLIVAVLSIEQPRTVLTGAKYGKQRETELVKVLVGDETKTDFSITMWLPREMHVNWKDGAKATPEGSRSNLRRSLKIVRPRDVILLQNVALSSFQGKVHGQSLRRDVTKVDLLFRKKIDTEDLPGMYTVQSLRNATDSDPQLLKVKRVRDWMVNFVGEGGIKTTARRGRLDRGSSYRGVNRMLPPDTQ